MDPNTRALVMGAAGSGGEKIYVEDVFSTFLYTGNGSTQTITNGINLSGKSGCVWLKSRSPGGNTYTVFNDSGTLKDLYTNGTVAAGTATWTSWNNNGFALSGVVNTSSETYASWTFRKAAKFFDVVTYVGNGSTQNIAHSLGSVPGFIVIKRTDSTSNWICWHRSIDATNNNYLLLNATSPADTTNSLSPWPWNSTTPTSTEFSVAYNSAMNQAFGVNVSGGTYVAYLFAHNAGGFGDSGNDNVVSCGSFQDGPSFSGQLVNLGWEPQWVMIKRIGNADVNSTFSANWQIYDVMRGLGVENNLAKILRANTTEAQISNQSTLKITSQGFVPNLWVNTNDTYIYIAIRRGPMKTPTDATTVFGLTSSTGDISIGAVQPSSYALPWSRVQDVDMVLGAQQSGNAKNFQIADLVRGFQSSTTQLISTATTPTLSTSNTNAEETTGNFFFQRTGLSGYPDFIQGASSGVQWAAYRFKRAPGFFDVVGYTGTGSARTISHNLGVAPELMILKMRGSFSADNWYVASQISSSGHTRIFFDSAMGVYWSGYPGSGLNSAPTSSSLSLTGNSTVNFSGNTYIAYLFASCPGVSKVSSYTGTGTTLNIDCGFTNGARFVLIKRTDSTGDWYVWDTARGIVSGNDPYLLLNSTAAEVTSTDYIDPLNSGFEISSTAPAAINANGGNFIYLAIA